LTVYPGDYIVIADYEGAEVETPVTVTGDDHIIITIRTPMFLTGTVYDVDGVTPVPDGIVYYSGHVSGKVYTSEDGTYSIQLYASDAGYYTVYAEAAGNSSSRSMVYVDTDTVKDLYLTNSGTGTGTTKHTLSGLVIDNEGNRLANALVTLRYGDDKTKTMQTSTSASGAYRFQVEDGTYYLTAVYEADNGRNYETNAETAAHVTGADLTDVNLVIVFTFDVTVTVVDENGNPVPNAIVTFDGASSGSLVTGEDGTVTEKLPGGEYTFQAEAGNRKTPVENVIVNKDTDVTLTIGLPGLKEEPPLTRPEDMTISGTVIDPTGNPVENAEVTLLKFNIETEEWEPIETKPSDENGGYTFEGLDDGRYRVDVKYTQTTTETGKPTSFEIDGYALDDNENPYVGAQVNLYDEEGQLVQRVYSDEDGYYQFLNLKEGNYTVEIIPANDEGAHITKEDVTAKPSNVVIDGVVTDVTGKPVEGAVVVVTSSEGVEWPMVTTGDGVYSFSLPADGDYTVAITYPSSTEIDTENYERDENDPNAPKLMDDSYTIYGYVHETDDQPIENATVILKDADGNELNRTLTNVDGSYEFPDNKPGDYIVEVIWGKEQKEYPVHIGDGDKDPDPGPEPGPTPDVDKIHVSGTVITNHKRPLADAVIIIKELDLGTTSQVYSDADGRFHTGEMEKGRYEIHAEYTHKHGTNISTPIYTVTTQEDAELVIILSYIADVNGDGEDEQVFAGEDDVFDTPDDFYPADVGDDGIKENVYAGLDGKPGTPDDWYPWDVDHDGEDEKVYVGEDTIPGTPDDWYPWDSDGDGEADKPVYIGKDGIPATEDDWYPYDVDEDGTNEPVYVGKDTQPGTPDDWYLWDSDGDGEDDKPVYVGEDGIPATKDDWYPWDADHDGEDEQVFIDGDNTPGTPDDYYLFDVDDDGEDEKVTIGADGIPGTPDDLYPWDSDDNGEDDTMIYVGEDGTPNTPDDWYPLDVDGDGKDEPIYIGEDKAPGTEDDWYPFDVDGDGKDELIYTGEDKTPGTSDDWYPWDVDDDGENEHIYVGEDETPGTGDDWYPWDADGDDEDEIVYIGGDGIPGTDDDWYWEEPTNPDEDPKPIVFGVTIRFDSNGGAIGGSHYVEYKLSELKTLPTPVRDKYSFVGWFTEPTGGTKMDLSAVKALTVNTTLYAHWISTVLPCNVTVILVDTNGNPVPNATVTFDGVNSGKLTTGQDGTATVRLPSGEYTFQAAIGNRETDIVRVTIEKDIDVTLTIAVPGLRDEPPTVKPDDLTVSGTVIDPNGNPVENAKVTLLKFNEKTGNWDVVDIGSNTTFRGNATNGGGGAIYVADNGVVNIKGDNIQFTNNTAAQGGSIYAASQTDQTGRLSMNGTGSTGIVFSANTASGNGGAMYVADKSNASVSGKVKAASHLVANKSNNIYLAKNATLDIAASVLNSSLNITCEDEYAYRPVSYPVDGYHIATEPAPTADEAFWADDCGTWDIRYMEYNGVPALYLYYYTIDAKFSDVDTLLTVNGKDLTGTVVDYLDDETGIPNKTNSNGLLTVPSIIAKSNAQSLLDEDFVVTFTCNEKGDGTQYRIPTEDIVTVTSGGKAVPFTYEPNFEEGTAKITIARSVVDGLTKPLEFGISAEEYFHLTLRMEGPLFEMSTDITGLNENIVVLSESEKKGNTAKYKVDRDGKPLPGVEIELYKEGTNEITATQTTNAEGRVSFTGLDENATYYIILKYAETYRLIGRDTTSIALSTLEGQTLAPTCIKTTGTATYDPSTGAAAVKDVLQDGTVTFSVNQARDTITFVGNEGKSTTALATLTINGKETMGQATKEMEANANSYGILPEAYMKGYIFDGWFTEPDGGVQVTSNTPYETQVSTRALYAHWTPRNDTMYTIQHWVEYSEGGANPRYGTPNSTTKVVGDTTYYLYETHIYDTQAPYSEPGTDIHTTRHFDADGVSDNMRDITSLDLQSMSSTTYSWWSRDQFTAMLDKNCKVLADGSSVFNVYYNRDSHTINFVTPVEAGTASNPDPIDPKDVEFGSLIDALPTPCLPGYEFGGWHMTTEDGSEIQVTATDIYRWDGDIELIAKWNPRKTTKWAIKVVTQNIDQYSDGEYFTPGTYTENKTVYLDNDGHMLQGVSDTEVTFSISDIRELSIEGFHYVGYSAQYEVHGVGMQKSDSSATVYVKPTDALTKELDAYNENFDGGIVWLYYDRKTLPIQVTDSQGVVHDDEIIYGGDFTGHLPDDPGKDGYDFDHWVDPDGNPVDNLTSANDYILSSDGTPLELSPVWNVRSYNLTYVPGANAEFVATVGTTGKPELSTTVPGGYIDPNKVTYDQPMGDMPSARKPGYSFDGWFVEGEQITPETIVNTSNVVISNADQVPPFGYEDTRALSAQYTPHEYTLLFYPGRSTATNEEATVSPISMKVTYDQIISGLPTPTLRGYRFVSWLLDASNPATALKNGQTWDHVYTNYAEIPVYATWVPENYRYTFDLNDTVGSTRASLLDTTIEWVDQSFDSVYDGIFAVEAVRNGYNFKGWALSAGASSEDVLTVDDLNRLASNATLYAIWEPISYNVRLVMKGGSIANLSDNTDPSIYDPSAVYDEETDTWTIQVKFDSTYGELPAVTKEDATYHGYLVNAPGWPALGGYGITIHNEIITSLPQYIDHQDKDGITLTAVLEPWLTFDPDGNKFVGDTDVSDPIKILQSEIKELPEVEKEHYTFEGWQDEDGNPVDLEAIKEMTEPTTLTPVFVPNIIMDANGGEIDGAGTLETAVNQLDKLPVPEKEGYTFVAWTDSEGHPVTYEDIKDTEVPVELIASYTPNITFDANGGKIDEQDRVIIPLDELLEMDKLPTPVREHYTFVEWQDANGKPVKMEDFKPVQDSDKPDEEYKPIDSPTELKAVYMAHVTFDANGGVIDNAYSLETPGALLEKLPPPASRTNYRFDGWYDAKSGGKKVTLDTLKAITEPMTVYAHWTYSAPGGGTGGGGNIGGGGGTGGGGGNIDHGGGGGGGSTSSHKSYTVTFDTNGGSTIEPQTTKGKVKKPADPAKLFYEFVGWYTDNNLTKAFDFDSDKVKKDTTLYAKWNYLGANEYLTTDHIAYIAGMPDGTVQPESDITRAEVAMIFYRLLNENTRAQYKTTSNQFTDVSSADWSNVAVSTLANMKILLGRGNDIFDPGAKIIRAEFAVIASRFEEMTPGKMIFSDVPENHWAYKEIVSAAENGWVVGYGDGRFGPDDNITRAETMTIINRVLGRDTVTENGMITSDPMIKWPDNADTKAWYYLAVQEATNSHKADLSGKAEVWTELVDVKPCND